jgi:hypothetical protein
MAPFFWLHCLVAAIYATSSAVSPARDVLRPRAINLPHESLDDSMYAGLNFPTMNLS